MGGIRGGNPSGMGPPGGPPRGPSAPSGRGGAPLGPKSCRCKLDNARGSSGNAEETVRSTSSREVPARRAFTAQRYVGCCGWLLSRKANCPVPPTSTSAPPLPDPAPFAAAAAAGPPRPRAPGPSAAAWAPHLREKAAELQQADEDLHRTPIVKRTQAHAAAPLERGGAAACQLTSLDSREKLALFFSSLRRRRLRQTEGSGPGLRTRACDGRSSEEEQTTAVSCHQRRNPIGAVHWLRPRLPGFSWPGLCKEAYVSWNMAETYAAMTAVAGPSVGIGNYKGVMICNRPFAGVVSAAHAAGRPAGPIPSFLCGTVPREIGQPAPTVMNRSRQPPKPRRLQALIKHRKWLKELQNAKDRCEVEFLQRQSEKEEARKRFIAKEAKIRRSLVRAGQKEQAAKGEPQDDADDADDDEQDEQDEQVKGAGEEAKEGLRDALTPAKKSLQTEHSAADKAEGKLESEVQAKAQAKGDQALDADPFDAKADKKPLKNRPMWALTKEQAEDEEERQEDEDADELLEFVANLDFDEYLRDSEIAALLRGVKSRILEIEQEGKKEELEELKQLNYEQRRLEEQQRAQAEASMKFARDSKAYAIAKPKEGEDGRRVATGSLEGAKGLGIDYAEAALTVELNRSYDRPDRAAGAGEGEEEWEFEGDPKIVTYTQDEGSRLEYKKDPSYLPYMHRNPAV
eukprot:scaffold576_cov260-Pinguiococcus_pyrenoidosus.AAC.5